MKNCTASRMCSAYFLLAGLAMLAAVPRAAGQTVIGFEDVSLPGGGVLAAVGADTTFFSGGASFNAEWNETFNCCASGFAFSNLTDLTTSGFTNPYSAYASPPTGGGVGGSATFAVANNFEIGSSVVTLPEPAEVQGAYFTNITYAYLAVVDGDDGGAGFARQFVDGDFFRLDIIGKDAGGAETGLVEFYLADYRNGNSFAAGDWTWVDLTPLGDGVQSLEFDLISTDAGMFGINTPSYFALDDLTFSTSSGVAVPEPSSLTQLLLCLGAAILPLLAARRSARLRRQ